MKYSFQVFLAITVLTISSTGCFTAKTRVNDPTDLRSYVESAHRTNAETDAAEGSLWNGNGYYSDPFRDPKARYVNDMVTILVLETTQAVASANAKNSRNTSAAAGFSQFFGAEKHISELPNFVSGKTSSSFEGKGSTSRATVLETTLTARVVDVLPNGYLVLEGMREIRVNDENQSVYLSGVVRPEDISPNNSVLSSSIAQMSVRVQGRGVVSQPIKPGWLYRILTGVLPF
jgi:flagellar L-ring protein precursor FlgH